MTLYIVLVCIGRERKEQIKYLYMHEKGNEVSNMQRKGNDNGYARKIRKSNLRTLYEPRI